MKVLIQKNKNGDFPNLNFFQANEGFRELGYNIEYFHWDTSCVNNPMRRLTSEYDFVPIDKLGKEAVVVGGVPVIDEVYKQLGVINPVLTSYPDLLKKYLKRKVIFNNMRDIKEYICKGNNIPIFVKPTDSNRKLFTGGIFKEFKDLIRVANVPDMTLCFQSEIVDFISEYRVFVHNKKIVGMKHYKGDFMIFPADGVIEMMVDSYKNCPIAYALDIGVMTEIYRGRDGGDKQRYATALVEVNDSNALGCYGLGPVTYAKMIAARWEEVMNGI